MEVEVWYFWENFQLYKKGPIIDSKLPVQTSSLSWEAFLSRLLKFKDFTLILVCNILMGTLLKASFSVWSDIRLLCVKALSFCLLFSFLSASPLLPILLGYIWLSLHLVLMVSFWSYICWGAEVEVETNFCVYCECNFATPEECGCSCVGTAFL